LGVEVKSRYRFMPVVN